MDLVAKGYELDPDTGAWVDDDFILDGKWDPIDVENNDEQSDEEESSRQSSGQSTPRIHTPSPTGTPRKLVSTPLAQVQVHHISTPESSGPDITSRLETSYTGSLSQIPLVRQQTLRDFGYVGGPNTVSPTSRWQDAESQHTTCDSKEIYQQPSPLTQLPSREYLWQSKVFPPLHQMQQIRTYIDQHSTSETLNDSAKHGKSYLGKRSICSLEGQELCDSQ